MKYERTDTITTINNYMVLQITINKYRVRLYNYDL